MSFCKFSPSYQTKDKTIVDNTFINDFLPTAPDLCVKAYLLGLSKCGEDDTTNSLSFFAETLKVCEDDIISIFKYWEDKGLIQVLSTEPVEIRYLPISKTNVTAKQYNANRYNDFNIQLQELFTNHMITPNEYLECYDLLESKHIEQKALLAITKYCINLKGFTISPSYALTVAKDWINQGILSFEQVNAKIQELGIVDDKITIILESMGTKRKVQIEDKELLNKWLNSFGFEFNVLVFVARSLKERKRRLDINILDEYLTRYYEMKLQSIPEIENYENQKETLYQIAKTINKELGIFYEDLSKEIDTYIVNYINMGFDLDTLQLVADNCFKSSIRTLEGYNNIINKLFKLGITTTPAYMQYLNDNLAVDEKIKQILSAVNLMRNVNALDRNFYAVWTNDWRFGDDVILYGASLAKDKPNAIQYLNKILSNWKDSSLHDLSAVKQAKLPTDTPQQQNFIHNHYSKEQIASFITNLDEVEI